MVVAPFFALLYGSNLFGSRGNNDARLMLFNFKNNIKTRSKPIPPPPCGAQPKRNASTYAFIESGSTPFARIFSESRAGSWIRWAPERISSPRMKKS